MWRCHPQQLYAVEVTVPNREGITEHDRMLRESRTLSLLDLLPSILCLSPHHALEHMQTESTSNHQFKEFCAFYNFFCYITDDSKAMDHKEFVSESYQRTYQYIRRHIGGQNLDNFTFGRNVEGKASDCLNLILQ